MVLLMNVKECLDFFCVLFDECGCFVVNVLYILVYFGVFGVCVCCVVLELDLGFGDVVVMNYLGYGGLYFFDVMLIMLIFDGE